MRPRKAKPEEAHGPPAGKRSAWNGNQTKNIPSNSSKKAKALMLGLFYLSYSILSRFSESIFI
ncbi:hypothetical protein FZC75_12030 [Sutcliffiella horikoshii]|uniref:Uncharacterized protein n=1 Tax=Sutcliffiella horikoshii TaxID=79883 RepID=A0A5D4T9C0_9BACI|nr:hypothetical protein FZC75_12030 [Sutcliffiella horikoshii]